MAEEDKTVSFRAAGGAVSNNAAFNDFAIASKGGAEAIRCSVPVESVDEKLPVRGIDVR